MAYFFCCLSIIIIVYSLFMIVYRMLYKNGFNIKQIHLNTTNDSYIPDRREHIKIFSISLFFRLFMILLSIFIFSLFINGENNFLDFNGAINNWIKWDASHYLRIANGYASYVENGAFPTLVFFPAYPFFIMIFKLLFDEVIAGLMVSNLAFSIACVYIYKLVCMDYSKKTALITLLLINIFPFSFFFSGIMSESIFLLFSVMTLYYIRKHKWVAAGVFGFACTLSRSIGVFIIIPAIVELIEEYKLIKNVKNVNYEFKILLRKGLPLLLIPLGFGVYLYCNYSVTGDCFYFLKIQKEIWSQEYTPFYEIFLTNYSMFNYNTSFIMSIAFPQIVIICLSYLVLFFSVKKNRTMYTMWLFINIVVNTSMSWPISVCRYFICTIPLFIFMANYLRKHRYLFIGYVILSSIFLAIYFIAYLFGKIM